MNIKAAILSIIMAGSSLAYAATTTETTTSRIAVVDVHSILEKLPQMQTMRADLEKQFSTEHDAITKEQKTLTEKAEKLASNKSVMTEADYKTQTTALQKQQRELQTKQATFQQQVFAAQDNAMKSILDKITTTVTKIAEENHYDLVVPKNSTVYAAKNYDITSQVQDAISTKE